MDVSKLSSITGYASNRIPATIDDVARMFDVSLNTIQELDGFAMQFQSNDLRLVISKECADAIIKIVCEHNTKLKMWLRSPGQQVQENDEMFKDSIDNGPYQFKSEITIKDTGGVTEIRRPQRLKDLAGEDNLRESIHSYHLRFTKLINDMRTILINMSPMQITTKFVNHLQPEWIRFVTAAKQTKDLHNVNFDQLYAFLKHNEKDAKEVREMRQRFPESLALLANTYNPPLSYNRARVLNTVGNTGANQPRVVRCYNCNGEGRIAKKCTARKGVKDFEWFKDKMLLAQAQKAGVVLNEEQQNFLADSLEEIDDCEDLQLPATTNFKADHVDVYDSDCDDKATTNAVFMANLSPVGSLNDDTVEPRYDSDIHYMVPYYDTYHDSDMLNSNIQEVGYMENIVSNNESYDELKGNIDVISYNYMLNIGNDEDKYVPPLVQKNDMMLSVIEQMKSQVEKCNMVNQESKSVNESLTASLNDTKKESDF
nr:retrovirus-related Pol polyprotein from transposon TNT 1-94 [Tanacetum cinerariifolium]